ncbi:MAG: phenylalanine--tRNA ligase subunit beta [Peltula sp. TS41687]|nr:MAG: phenylalanine--tRNA ligase subunit beta [Peltula sp. TS41687]
MPTITVDKAALFRELGRESVSWESHLLCDRIITDFRYTTEQFDELCFDFGIELDEDTSNSERPITNGKQEPAQLKIEVPANRYDMLCFEGISRALNVFLGRSKSPDYRIIAPPDGEVQVITVHKETSQIRPYVSGAVLRNIKFDQDRYDSFIALQDKLHQNLARQRTLVSIGTHDLDTIKGPFTYEALPPEQINFVPLNQGRQMNGKELMQFYETRNVFIEITATDKTKVEVVNNILVCMFSQYTEEPFTVEPVKIVSPHNGGSRQAPDLAPRETQADIPYINDCCGLDLSAEEICRLLTRMSFQATPSKTSRDLIDVQVPPTRADVLHQCDIMEDVAVSYGFNKLPKTFPGRSGTIAQPLMINKLGDIVRLETAMAGWSEVMPLILCSHDENFAWLNRKDDGKTAVKLANPKTAEYQVVRTSLLPGLLKTIRENKHHSVPIKVFEVSDVAFKDLSLERKSRNERHFAAAWCGKTSGFEVVHGLLDRVMLMLKSAFITHEEGLEGSSVDGYWIEEADDPTFFPGHAATVHVRLNGKSSVIGIFGILHPTVLQNFEFRYPASALEINLEVFL